LTPLSSSSSSSSSSSMGSSSRNRPLEHPSNSGGKNDTGLLKRLQINPKQHSNTLSNRSGGLGKLALLPVDTLATIAEFILRPKHLDLSLLYVSKSIHAQLTEGGGTKHPIS
jgi:hypothetical protein